MSTGIIFILLRIILLCGSFLLSSSKSLSLNSISIVLLLFLHLKLWKVSQFNFLIGEYLESWLLEVEVVFIFHLERVGSKTTIEVDGFVFTKTSVNPDGHSKEFTERWYSTRQASSGGEHFFWGSESN